MGKRDLKQQNKDLEIHVVDLISRLDPSTTGKYTKFLTRILTDNMNNLDSNSYISELGYNTTIDDDFKKPKHTNDIERLIFDYLLRFYDMDNIRALFQFHRHTEEKRIVGKDVNSYNNWAELQKDVALATLKQNQKLLEKEVQKVFENEEWLIVRPLTIESSLTYGAGTKWCTASKQNKDYFYRYSVNGVLCYSINKIDGDKYGLYYDKNNLEFSIWNAPDKRIDSVESNIPSEIMGNTYKFMKDEKCNYDYFSDFEKERCEKFYPVKDKISEYPEGYANPQWEDEAELTDYDDNDALEAIEYDDNTMNQALLIANNQLNRFTPPNQDLLEGLQRYIVNSATLESRHAAVIRAENNLNND